MTHDVYICYSAKDNPSAEEVVTRLENDGIRCWMHTRDLTAGARWEVEISEAIKASKIMVLIFSAAANESSQVEKEVRFASSKNAGIIPFRIEDKAPSSGLEYFLSRTHWLDAFPPPLEDHLQSLSEMIMIRLGMTAKEKRVNGEIKPESDNGIQTEQGEGDLGKRAGISFNHKEQTDQKEAQVGSQEIHPTEETN